MSESVTTRTETVTETDTESEFNTKPLIEDRWSHNITYRQLVVSTCIGVYQLCWNPYLHDLRKLLPFMFLYNVFSILVAYPMFYLELAIGVATKKSVLNCWDLAPCARGIGIAMLFCCMFTALAASALGSRCLALLVHSMHSFLPWLHCAAGAVPPCAARHRTLAENAETPAQSFYNNFVLDLKRDGLKGGLGNMVWELTIYYVLCWMLIYFIAIKRIYSYSKLVLFKDVLAYFVLVTCAVGVLRLDGIGAIFTDYEWNSLFEGFEIWREAIDFSLLEMSVSQGSLVMLGSYLPKQNHKLGTTALLTMLASKTTCMVATMILAGNLAALKKDYDTIYMPGGTSTAFILWADYVTRIPGNQFWSALVFFTLFVLSISTAALLVQTMMSTFTGHILRKISWAFLILICVLFCLISGITICTQGGEYILEFLVKWPVSAPRIFIAATIASTVTYIYGQTAFCEDVYFAVGEYPSVFMRVCWAISPVLLMVVFALGLSLPQTFEKVVSAWIIVGCTVLPVVAMLAIYLVFKCRVRNIVGHEK